VRHGNLAALPRPDDAVDVVVNFQVFDVEHAAHNAQGTRAATHTGKA